MCIYISHYAEIISMIIRYRLSYNFLESVFVTLINSQISFIAFAGVLLTLCMSLALATAVNRK